MAELFGKRTIVEIVIAGMLAAVAVPSGVLAYLQIRDLKADNRRTAEQTKLAQDQLAAARAATAESEKQRIAAERTAEAAIRQANAYDRVAEAIATVGAIRTVEPPQPHAETSQRGPSIISDPAWVVQPDPSYPPSSYDVLRAMVQLHCFVEVSGSVSGCSVLSEDPPGRGFGESAMAAAYRARATPRTVDNVPSRAEITYTTRFSLPSTSP